MSNATGPRWMIGFVALAVATLALRWLTKPGSPRQDMVAGYQLIAIVGLGGTVLAVLWGRL